MTRTWLTRAAVIGTTALAAIGLAAAPAAAADRYLGATWGSMTHIDDGDQFKICDIKADGHGVTGYLKERKRGSNVTTNVLVIDDGGDDGCDYGSFDVLAEHDYMMVISWNGDTSSVVLSSWFSE